MSMNNGGCCACDGIRVDVMKVGFPVLGEILLNIINCSFVTGIVPSKWKASIVRPIYKTGDTSDPGNFRPTSLVPNTAKIAEKLVSDQLIEYFDSDYLIYPTQRGFRRQHSTESALLSITEKAYRAMDAGQVTLLCLLDLSKAFDCVQHQLLLDKLSWYGVQDPWFKNYMSEHTQMRL